MEVLHKTRVLCGGPCPTAFPAAGSFALRLLIGKAESDAFPFTGFLLRAFTPLLFASRLPLFMTDSFLPPVQDLLPFHRRHTPPLQFGIGSASHAAERRPRFSADYLATRPMRYLVNLSLPQARSGRLSLDIPIPGHQFPKAPRIIPKPRHLAATGPLCAELGQARTREATCAACPGGRRTS